MKLKMISIIAVIAAGIIVVAATLSGYAQTEKEYNTYLSKARQNAAKEIPYNAYQNYKSALAMRCEDEAIFLEYLEQARLLDESYYRVAVEEYVAKFPESANAYELYCEQLYNRGSYKLLIETALIAREKGIATEKVRAWYLECSYMLKSVMSGFDDAQSFMGNYARVMVEGRYGYIKANGSYLIAPYFEGATVMMGSNAAVNDGVEWHMINTLGYKVARSSEPVDSMSILNNGKIAISKNGKYGYTTSALTVPDTLPYDYASTFKNGVAAVKKGDKWALINANEEPITEYVFEDILLDEFDSCINGGVIFVKHSGKYYMVNAEGTKISQQGFDDAWPFAGAEPAAVCIDGKWGFVSTGGEMVIQPQYEGARSFSIGLGGVCVDGLWGYISSTGEFRVECQFEDCKPFASSGIAAVKEEGLWKYVQLLGYQE